MKSLLLVFALVPVLAVFGPHTQPAVPQGAAMPTSTNQPPSMRFKRMKTLTLFPEPCLGQEWVPPQYVVPEFYPEHPKQCPVGSVPASWLAPPQTVVGDAAQDGSQDHSAYGCWVCGRQFSDPNYYAQHIATCSPAHDHYTIEERVYGLDQHLPEPADSYHACCSSCGRHFYTPVEYVRHLHHCGGEWVNPNMVSAGALDTAPVPQPAPGTGGVVATGGASFIENEDAQLW